MSKHLTLSDRAIIEKYLAQNMPFSYIAKQLHRSPSTISMEVKNHRRFVNGYRYSDNPCINYRSCIRRNLFDQESIYSCHHRCKNCNEFNCNELCSQFVSFNCEALSKPPYVCTECPDEKSVNVITLITLPSALMLNIANSYTMLVLALEPVLNILWN